MIDFGSYSKYDYRQENILGQELSLIDYYPKTECIFSLVFEYGEVTLNFKINKLKRQQYETLLQTLRDADNVQSKAEESNQSDLPKDEEENMVLLPLPIENNCKQLEWFAVYKTYNIKESPENELSGIAVHNSNSSNNIEKLTFAVQTFAQLASFPPEMISDILGEINTAITNQKTYIDGLTKRLTANDYAAIKDIQKRLENCRPECEESKVIIKWIRFLAIKGRLQDAIAWCNVFPECQMHYLSAQEIALELLMQLKNMVEQSKKGKEMEKNEEENEEEMIFSYGVHADLSYLETVFMHAWNIAKKTGEERDISLASHYYKEISGIGLSVNDHSSSVNLLSSGVDVFIEHARSAKKLRNEKNLRFEKIDLQFKNKNLQLENTNLHLKNVELNQRLKQLELQLKTQVEAQLVSPNSTTSGLFKNKKSLTTPFVTANKDAVVKLRKSV